MLHIIIGNGKGKTSAAVGSAVRAAGRGRSVLFVQFLKNGSSGEIGVLKNIGVELLLPTVDYGFTFNMTAEQLYETKAEYAKMMEKIAAADAFMVVLDEVLHALDAGLVSREQLEAVIGKDCEIILTGYDAPKWLLDRADYISEINKRRHPFDKGIEAREGVEY